MMETMTTIATAVVGTTLMMVIKTMKETIMMMSETMKILTETMTMLLKTMTKVMTVTKMMEMMNYNLKRKVRYQN